MIIWCASYPKSGNTWIRAIISSLLYSNDGIFNFYMLKKIGLFPRRYQFKEFTNNYIDLNNVSKYWIDAQKKINSDGKLRIFKTHNGNYNFSGNNFTDKNNTLAVIYIVRDPRNMITSLSNHYQYNFEESTDFLLDEKKILLNKDPKYTSDENVINLLGSWKSHYNSWKATSNLLLIRYEDLLMDVKSEIYRLSEFLRKFGHFDINDKKVENIIETTSFEMLKKKEEHEGFEEAVNSKIKFFNLGPKNDWKNIVDKKLINKIENNFKNEMKELKYLF